VVVGRRGEGDGKEMIEFETFLFASSSLDREVLYAYSPAL
jgi:hypothetical protein